MKLHEPRVEEGSLGADRLRVVARVTYAGETGSSEDYWFEIPAAVFDGELARGDAWLVALFPLAVSLGESLELSVPVDRHLRDNLLEMLRVWRSWYSYVEEVDLHCQTRPGEGERRRQRVGALFSGGVDSFFTLLRDRDRLHPLRRRRVEDLVTVWGYDIPLSRPEAFGRVRARFHDLASEVGCEFLEVATNLRETRWTSAPWGELSHGCALAAAGHFLGGRLGTVYVPATGGYRDLHPWGSHPLTDPLLSSARISFVHDGADTRRVDKLSDLVRSPLALGELRVCWRSETDENCGKCMKCLRTMIGLELLDALSSTSRFDAHAVTPERVANLYCAHPWDYRELEDLVKLAASVGRDDLAAALEASITGSRRRSRILELLEGAGRSGILGRLTEGIEGALLRGWIR